MKFYFFYFYETALHLAIRTFQNKLLRLLTLAKIKGQTYNIDYTKKSINNHRILI